MRSIEGDALGGGTPGNVISVADVRAGFLNLYVNEYFLIIRMIMRLGASLQDAEDAVQDAFTEAWQFLTARPDKWGEVSNPEKYIRAVALRKFQRPPATRGQAFLLPVPEIPESVLYADAGHEELTLGTLHVLNALRNLEPLLRVVLTLHMDGFSAPEIAVRVGIKDDQKVRDLLKKARKILRRELASGRD